jgi:hypothetical protein
VPEDIEILQQILGNTGKLLERAPLPSAILLLKRGADLIIGGIHFDDSRMFDLLRIAKADPELRGIPFLCFRDIDANLRP